MRIVDPELIPTPRRRLQTGFWDEVAAAVGRGDAVELHWKQDGFANVMVASAAARQAMLKRDVPCTVMKRGELVYVVPQAVS